MASWVLKISVISSLLGDCPWQTGHPHSILLTHRAGFHCGYLFSSQQEIFEEVWLNLQIEIKTWNEEENPNSVGHGPSHLILLAVWLVDPNWWHTGRKMVATGQYNTAKYLSSRNVTAFAEDAKPQRGEQHLRAAWNWKNNKGLEVPAQQVSQGSQGERILILAIESHQPATVGPTECSIRNIVKTCIADVFSILAVALAEGRVLL